MERRESPGDIKKRKEKAKLPKEGNMYGDYRITSDKHLGKMVLAESKGCLSTDRQKNI